MTRNKKYTQKMIRQIKTAAKELNYNITDEEIAKFCSKYKYITIEPSEISFMLFFCRHQFLSQHIIEACNHAMDWE